MSGQMTASRKPLLLLLAERLSQPVAAHAGARARLHLIDWLGCAAAGRSDGLAPALAAIAPLDTHPKLFPVLGRGHASALQALLIHSLEGSALESDDVERRALLHPAAVVIPAALAAASPETRMRELLAAIVRGYEAMIRIGRALGPRHYRLWHPSSTAGAFGAAAAVASLRGLCAEATAHALATAGSRTGGLWQMRHEPVPTKRLHFALAALEGFLAAHWAAIGLRGPLTLLEGQQGLFAATAPDADPAAIQAGSSEWLIFEVSFKPYPACRHAHPAIDALSALLPLAGEEIERIAVETFAAAVDFCDRPQPTQELEARFSIQHALAARILLGEPKLAHYREPWLRDAALAALRARIAVTEAPELSARFPAHFGARVRVQLKNGEVRCAEVRDALGDPERPWPTEAVLSKALAFFADAGVGMESAQRLLALVQTLPDEDPIAPLLNAIAGEA